jgi:thioredoxin
MLMLHSSRRLLSPLAVSRLSATFTSVVSPSYPIAQLAAMRAYSTDATEDASAVIDVTEANWTTVVEHSDVPVVVDCHADWCGPCRVLAPRLTNLVAQRAGAVRMVKLDIDQSANARIVESLRVSAVPTVIGFVKGRPVTAFQGVQPNGMINQFLDKLVEESRSPPTGDESTP